MPFKYNPHTGDQDYYVKGVTLDDTVVEETSFGQASTAGVSTNASRADHTHGTPAAPISNVVTRVVGTYLHGSSNLYLSDYEVDGTLLILTSQNPGSGVVWQNMYSNSIVYQINGTPWSGDGTFHQAGFANGQTMLFHYYNGFWKIVGGSHPECNPMLAQVAAQDLAWSGAVYTAVDFNDIIFQGTLYFPAGFGFSGTVDLATNSIVFYTWLNPKLRIENDSAYTQTVTFGNSAILSPWYGGVQITTIDVPPHSILEVRAGYYNDPQGPPPRTKIYLLHSDATDINNVQPDWSQTDTGAWDYIKNKPNITVSTSDPSGGNDGDIWIKYTP